MEYIFGTIFRNGKEVRNLKTINNQKHSNLKGYCVVERKYPDNTITDEFKIVKKYKSDQTSENYYDWYEITDYNRYIDKFSPVQEEINNNINDSQDALCDLSENLEDRVAELENALCELSQSL